MDDTEDLRTSLESAFDAVDAGTTNDTSTGAPAGTATPPGDAASTEAAAQRARDEGGRFAKSTQAAADAGQVAKDLTAGAQAQAGAPAAAAGAIDPVAAAAATGPRQAPSSWKKEAAAAFATLPQHVQDEVLRREGDYHKGVEGWKVHAKAGQAYEQAFAPYQATLKALGVDGVTAVNELMKVDHILRHAPDSVKTAKLLELAQVYRIDLSKQFSPEIARYEQELFQTREKLQNIESQNAAQANQTLNSELERFAAAPGHELFETVRVHMASLLSGGVAKDLEDAYQQAVFANPQTRATLLDQQRRRNAEEAQAQRARAATGSVRGSSPAAGASTAAAASASIKDAVSAAFDAHS